LFYPSQQQRSVGRNPAQHPTVATGIEELGTAQFTNLHNHCQERAENLSFPIFGFFVRGSNLEMESYVILCYRLR